MKVDVKGEGFMTHTVTILSLLIVVHDLWFDLFHSFAQFTAQHTEVHTQVSRMQHKSVSDAHTSDRLELRQGLKE